MCFHGFRVLFELIWRDYFRFLSVKYRNSLFHLGKESYLFAKPQTFLIGNISIILTSAKKELTQDIYKQFNKNILLFFFFLISKYNIYSKEALKKRLKELQYRSTHPLTK